MNIAHQYDFGRIATSTARTGGVIAVGMAVALAAGAQEVYENPPILTASQILPVGLRSGPDFRVEERVVNDGYMNRYTISSRFGTVEAVSTATLRKYTSELGVVAQIDALQGSDEFKKNLKKGASDVVQGAANLVVHPVQTVSGAVSGIGKLFRRAGDSVFGDPASDAEDGGLKSLLGFSATKREYAKAFGVDAYSRNPILQRHLDDIARAGYLGGLTTSVALMAVPGAAGVGVSVSKGSKTLGAIDMSVPPTDLRRMNRQSLEGMGVSKDVIDLFLGNSTYTPTEQTLLVAALADMKRVVNRGEFIKFAVQTGSGDVAYFRQRQAQMYRGFDRVVQPITRFVPVGALAAAFTVDGVLAFNVPLDYLVWTAEIGRAVEAATFRARKMTGLKRKELWIAGGISQRARAELEKRGWQVFPDAASRLLAGS